MLISLQASLIFFCALLVGSGAMQARSEVSRSALEAARSRPAMNPDHMYALTMIYREMIVKLDECVTGIQGVLGSEALLSQRDNPVKQNFMVRSALNKAVGELKEHLIETHASLEVPEKPCLLCMAKRLFQVLLNLAQHPTADHQVVISGVLSQSPCRCPGSQPMDVDDDVWRFFVPLSRQFFENEKHIKAMTAARKARDEQHQNNTDDCFAGDGQGIPCFCLDCKLRGLIQWMSMAQKEILGRTFHRLGDMTVLMKQLAKVHALKKSQSKTSQFRVKISSSEPVPKLALRPKTNFSPRSPEGFFYGVRYSRILENIDRFYCDFFHDNLVTIINEHVKLRSAN